MAILFIITALGLDPLNEKVVEFALLLIGAEGGRW